MILKYRHKTINWIDIASPEKEEIGFVFEENNIPSSFVDLIKRETKEEDYIEKDGCLIVCYPPLDDSAYNIVLIKNSNCIITIHDKEFKSFKKFANNLELYIRDNNESLSINNDIVYNAMIKTIIKDLVYSNNSKNINIKNLETLIKKKDFYFYVLSSIILLIIIISYVSIFI